MLRVPGGQAVTAAGHPEVPDREAPRWFPCLAATHMSDGASDVMAAFELSCQLPARLWCSAWSVLRW